MHGQSRREMIWPRTQKILRIELQKIENKRRKMTTSSVFTPKINPEKTTNKDQSEPKLCYEGNAKKEKT
jgi:hypothetical protein